MSAATPSVLASPARRLLAGLIGGATLVTSVGQLGVALAAGEPDHLVISEVVTGGASASDELIELHNPTTAALPLEGLELIYVTSSGATITRRSAWAMGAATVPAGGHVLVANEAGLYAGIADALYASGMAASGGSVALRIQGASSAIDAVGWGSAANAWLEGTPVAAPIAGGSVERRPGGALGSTQDTDRNADDFVQRAVPEPQNLGSAPTPDPAAPPPTPTQVPSPTLAPTAVPTATAMVTPAPTPSPAVISIEAARAAPDGAIVTIEGTATTDSDFHDGGGFVADATGGIAVLLADGSFGRGDHVRVRGEIDDRFSQRTLRGGAADLEVIGPGSEPAPRSIMTGAIGEDVEGDLVRVGGLIVGPPSELTTGIAFDIDDGSGPTRLVVGTGTGIDTAGWASGTFIELVGVAGQRDSSGTGADGYRVMPRDTADVLGVTSGSPAPSATATPSSGSASPSPTATPSPEGIVSIADARRAPKNARLRIRGTVTLATGIVDAATAVVQDASGAILLRLGDDVGTLALGERVEVSGARSTKAGMESLRVTQPVQRLGRGADPEPRSLRTGDAGESREAQLVVVRGALVAAARRASSGTVSFEIDDGSGPLRIVLGAALDAEDDAFPAGTWVEVRGVLGQETTGALPTRGYRIWPRAAGDVRIVAAVRQGDDGEGGSTSLDPGGSSLPARSLDVVGGSNLAGMRVGATLVHGAWPELAIGGLLWNGAQLVAVDPSSGALVAGIGRGRALPVALELTGLIARGRDPELGAPRVALGAEPGDWIVADATVAAPRASLQGAPAPAWVSLVGRAEQGSGQASLVVDGGSVDLAFRCDDGQAPPTGVVAVTGVLTTEPTRILVPCGGIRPAPSVAHGSGRAGVPPSTRPAPPSFDAASARVEGDVRRAIGAGLLGLAALVLVAAAAARRWLPQPDPEAATTDDSAPSVDAGRDAPRLTLVRVPHEHGP